MNDGPTEEKVDQSNQPNQQKDNLDRERRAMNTRWLIALIIVLVILLLGVVISFVVYININQNANNYTTASSSVSPDQQTTTTDTSSSAGNTSTTNGTSASDAQNAASTFCNYIVKGNWQDAYNMLSPQEQSMPYYNQNVSTFQSSFSEYDLGDNSHGQHAQTSGYPSDYQLTSCTIYGTPIDESNNGQGIPTYEVLFYWNFTDKATTEARVTMIYQNGQWLVNTYTNVMTP